MSDGPRFEMLGDPEALVCEDGVCAMPGAPAEETTATMIGETTDERRAT